MNQAQRNQIDLRLHILAVVRSPAKFELADVARVLDCPLKLVEEIAEQIRAINPEPTSPMTLEEIGRIIGISPQAVGQVEATALQRMRHPTRMKILMEARTAIMA